MYHDKRSGRSRELCIPEIIALKKLKYIGFPPEGVCGFGRSGVLLIVKASPSLRILDCQEGYMYFFVQEKILGDCQQQL